MTKGGSSNPARPLVIAVGNRFRSDDGVGAAVIESLGSDRAVTTGVDLVELDGEPTRLVEAWDGRVLTVVVDAVVVDVAVPAGRVMVLDGREALDPATVARWHTGVSGHSAGLAEALGLGCVLGRLPDRMCVVGIVASSLAEGPGLTPAVAEAVPRAAAAVALALESCGSSTEEVADVSG